jgi:3-hydroxyisobutyrate dehydrogenase-like beta-hydroxyacid dehydrogenase
MKIGFIGLGHMGYPMAERLLKAGHELIAYNRAAEKAQGLRAHGAKVARNVSEACQADVVITMVSDDAAIESLVFGGAGILRHLARGRIHVSSSSISPAMARRLTDAHAGAGQAFVAAPVLGRPQAVEGGELFVLAAGPRATLDTLDQVFKAIGQRTFIVSERPELALVVKLSCNFLVASAVETMGEAVALVEKAGVDPHRFLDVVTSTLFDAPAYKTYGALIAERRFEPAQFAAPLGAKDIRLALATAEDLRVPMPIASLLHDRFLALLAQGGERLDWSAIGGMPLRDAGIIAR